MCYDSRSTCSVNDAFQPPLSMYINICFRETLQTSIIPTLRASKVSFGAKVSCRLYIESHSGVIYEPLTCPTRLLIWMAIIDGSGRYIPYCSKTITYISILPSIITLTRPARSKRNSLIG